MSITFRFVVLAAAGVVAATGPARSAGPVYFPAPFTRRVLLVSAPRADDPLFRQQRATFADMADGARERDLVLVEAVGDTPAAASLRRRFDLDPAAFAVVLIGKDGGAKLRGTSPLGATHLFATIDAMPMRRREMMDRSSSDR